MPVPSSLIVLGPLGPHLLYCPHEKRFLSGLVIDS